VSKGRVRQNSLFLYPLRQYAAANVTDTCGIDRRRVRHGRTVIPTRPRTDNTIVDATSPNDSSEISSGAIKVLSVVETSLWRRLYTKIDVELLLIGTRNSVNLVLCVE